MIRSTFYAHYADQYDLMQQVEDEVIQNLHAYVDGYVEERRTADEYFVIRKILEYMLQNKENFVALLSGNGSKDFGSRIADMVRRYTINEWLKTGSVQPDTAEYLYTFAEAGGQG